MLSKIYRGSPAGIFSQCFKNCFLYVKLNFLEEKVLSDKTNMFQIFFSFELKFSSFYRFFGQVCKSATLCVEKNVLRKQIFEKNEHFGTLSGITSFFFEKFSNKLSKVCPTCPDENYVGKDFFFEENEFLPIFSDSGSKFFRFWRKVFN